MPGDGPHRSADFVEPCADCGARAIDACFRCNRPWCDEHRSFDEDLCRECDRRWLECKQRIESKAEVSPVLEYAVAAITPAAGFTLAIFAGGLGYLAAMFAAFIGFSLGLPLGSAVTRIANRSLHRRALRQLHRERARFLES